VVLPDFSNNNPLERLRSDVPSSSVSLRRERLESDLARSKSPQMSKKNCDLKRDSDGTALDQQLKYRSQESEESDYADGFMPTIAYETTAGTQTEFPFGCEDLEAHQMQMHTSSN